MPKSPTDKQIERWGKRLQKKADKALREGTISRVQYSDLSRVALRAVQPRDIAKVVGWK